MTETQKVPRLALCLSGRELIEFAAGEEQDQLDMVIYSGGVIKNHFWWGNLAIDLEGGSFPKARYPLLENHDQDRKIGFMGKPAINGNLTATKVTFVETDASEEFRRLSKQGFPYEASMYAVPSSVERIEPGESAKVNGLTLRGPATIWRKWTFKEGSVCTFGWDSNTKSSAFADEVELSLEEQELAETINKDKEKEVKRNMPKDLQEFRTEHPDETSALEQEVTETVTSTLTEAHETEKARLEQEKTDLEAKLAESKTSETEMAGRVDKLEANEEKRQALELEKERKDKADAIWTDKLADSDIPPHIHDKVMKQVGYTSFIKDDDLDIDGFTTAVEAEIKDWESRGMKTSVLGKGFTEKDDGASEATRLASEDDEAVAQTLVEMGQADNIEEARTKVANA